MEKLDPKRRGGYSMKEFEQIEYERITKEIQSDRETQFHIFLQTIVVISAVFVATFKIGPVPQNELLLLLLLPIWVLSHASLTMIYSRARSHNRKSAYLLVAYNDYGATSSWEKDMWVLRWNTRGVHRPDTFKQISIVLWIIQISVSVFVIANTFINRTQIHYELMGSIFMFFSILTLMKQTNNFFCLKYRDSIQGFAEYWTMVLNKNDWRNCSWLLDGKTPYYWVKIPEPWNELAWLKEFEKTPRINRFLFKLLLKIPKLVDYIPVPERGAYASVKSNKLTLVIFTLLTVSGYEIINHQHPLLLMLSQIANYFSRVF